jgi:dTMP kinase
LTGYERSGDDVQLNPGPGKLIVLEGLDGAGTTTQAAQLTRWLRAEGRVERVHVTSEPTPGPAGAQIRSVLTRRLSMDGYTLAALFAADRLDHLYSAGGVIARLQEGEWVIMDRYYLSSFAYQALALDSAGLRWLRRLHEHCVVPDVTFFLDAPVTTCMERIALNRGLHFELFEKQDTLEKVREKYLDAARRLRGVGENIQMLDGAARVTAVEKNVRERVRMMFLDDAYLSGAEQRTLWQEWPGLDEIRRQAEEQLNLAFVTVKKIPPAPGRPGGGNQGGRQIELADRRDRFYHVAGYFRDRGQAMHILPLGPSDTVLDALRALCPPTIQRAPQLPLNVGGS